jgi:hypothetical protein
VCKKTSMWKKLYCCCKMQYSDNGIRFCNTWTSRKEMQFRFRFRLISNCIYSSNIFRPQHAIFVKSCFAPAAGRWQMGVDCEWYVKKNSFVPVPVPENHSTKTKTIFKILFTIHPPLISSASCIYKTVISRKRRVEVQRCCLSAKFNIYAGLFWLGAGPRARKMRLRLHNTPRNHALLVELATIRDRENAAPAPQHLPEPCTTRRTGDDPGPGKCGSGSATLTWTMHSS